ncbi:hypothetical protein GTQ45_02030 [Pyruvatibacter mobilis]|uniref:Uncharacterized protein n=1 Tax=Pyruvatibacter mobilis TaxID=1712261 RepID=A0A845Q8F2_9HYPH|nr:hypothetical protein [Pyruvatibacter mobilis]NBG94510.1 hypothetical protein [Pyruvatibacter mobilis]QJD74030.1 hypothetical protein HG718_00580 [Pyruvatibacter mobilis]GGD03524.1 hypothetical protein GCM10011587_04060 [Pyruvatibacter mobilis]
MSSKASEEALERLHTAVAEELTRRIQSGEAKPADISAAVKFLKDNGIEADIGSSNADSATQKLADILPFPQSITGEQS